MTYYNEFDRKTAAWLLELIREGLISHGEVDERSISDVQPSDLVGYTRCHFFAGIGVWDFALHLAGWPADRPVWTGSCPCQPFSCAGKGKGKADERHLWPEFYRLIRECRPDTVFGEQVEGAIKHGWLDGVSADLEAEGYAVGSVVLGAHSVNAPHRRQRLYWVADSDSICGGEVSDKVRQPSGNSQDGRLGNTDNKRSQGRCECGECAGELPVRETGSWDDYRIIPFTDGATRRIESGIEPLAHGVSGRVAILRPIKLSDAEIQGNEEKTEIHWYSRVVALRGFGNAIVPQVASEFIRSYLSLTHETQRG